MSTASQIILDGSKADDPSTFVNGNGDGQDLSMLLTRDNGLTLFYDYVREISSVNERTFIGFGQKTTLFAPSNPSILHLHRKPHMGAPDSTPSPASNSSTDDEKAAFAYLGRWVSTHGVAEVITPESLREDGKEWTNLDGAKLTVECPKEKEEGEQWKGCKIMPGGALITGYVEATNGIIYTLNGTLDVQSKA